MNYICTLVDDKGIELNGFRRVANLEELYRVIVLEDTESVSLKEDFILRFWTSSGLHEFIHSLERMRPTIKIVSELKDTYNLAEDVSAIKLFDAHDLVHKILKNPERGMDIIKELCRFYEKGFSDSLQINNRLNTLYIQSLEMQDTIKYLTDKRDEALKDKQAIADRYNSLVTRINYSYDRDVSEDSLELVDYSNSYKRILYIKEITRVKYTDTLIQYLKEILQTLYSVPVRFVVIEPFFSGNRSELYPDCIPSFDLTFKDVKVSDIFMAGFQPNLMSDILANPSNVNFLIVLDRGGYKSPHIKANNMEVLYTVSDMKDIPKGVPLKNVLSYSKETLHIPHVKQFNELPIQKKLSVYSSLKCIKEIIKKMEVINS